MTVYIESVILDNFFATLLISDVSIRALSISRSKLTKFRMLLAACVGTAVALIYPLLKIHAALLFAVKFALFAVLALILFCKKGRKAGRVVSSSAVFLALTFAFGGVLFAIGFSVFGDAGKALRLPVTNLPVGLVAAGGWGAYLLSRKVARKLKRSRDLSQLLFRYEISVAGKTVTGTAFLDTGNRLYDAKTDLPVIVLGAPASLSILGDEGLSALLWDKEREVFPGARHIAFSGAGGKKSRLLILKPDAVRFYEGQAEHIIQDAVLGLSLGSFSDAAEYDVLLHPALVGSLIAVVPDECSSAIVQ
ncbi:MAG: sigma-E processing peptidase SpoIIGA [Firmicutes bacterium]|nr:sigma-E processing peptidase SpoIIGA [Bacillota bacterium]